MQAVRLQKVIRLARRRQVAVGEVGVVRPVDARGLREHGREVGGGRRADRRVVAARAVLLGQHRQRLEAQRGDLERDRPVVDLGRQQPVELPLHLVEVVGEVAARLGDRQRQRRQQRLKALERLQHHADRERAVGRVLAVVAGVVPAMEAGLDRIHQHAVQELLGGVLRVTGAVRPVRSVDVDVDAAAAALAEEAEHRVHQHAAERVVRDRERDRLGDAARRHQARERRCSSCRAT